MKNDMEDFNEIYDTDMDVISAIEEEKRILGSLDLTVSSSYEEEQSGEPSPRKLLKRDIKRMALLRLEDSARTEEDFKELSVYGTEMIPTVSGKNATTKSVVPLFPLNMVRVKTAAYFRCRGIKFCGDRF